MNLKEIATIGTLALSSIGISGCSTNNITGVYQGFHNDGDGGQFIKISGKEYYTGGFLRPDTLTLQKEYNFELTYSPIGDYISDVKPINSNLDLNKVI